MSGLTPLPIIEFRRLLRGRGSSIEKLAEEIGTARTYLSRVLWGDVESTDTRLRLHAVTTAQEWAGLCQMEHFATWNSARVAAGPLARVWLMREACGICGGDQRFVACVRAQARDVSHGICPACLRSQFPDLAAEILARASNQKVAA